jgi:hypothetical protein
VITRREFTAGAAALALAPVSACAAFKVTRHGPIITPNMLPGKDGASINYPSLIEVPEWVSNPLGRYYLYFSSHRHAGYIRLAYANEITGPWTVYAPGTTAVFNVISSCSKCARSRNSMISLSSQSRR